MESNTFNNDFHISPIKINTNIGNLTTNTILSPGTPNPWGTPPPKQEFGGSYWKYKKAVKEKKILKQKIKKKETKYHKMFEKMMIKMDKIEDYCNILEERIKSKQPFTPPSSIGSPNSPYKSYLEEDSSEKDKIKKNKKEPIWIRID